MDFDIGRGEEENFPCFSLSHRTQILHTCFKRAKYMPHTLLPFHNRELFRGAKALKTEKFSTVNKKHGNFNGNSLKTREDYSETHQALPTLLWKSHYN
jgi:hypothetical protein